MALSIPSYELYGDFLASRLSDPVHYETIKERSSQHNWTIRIHRHRGLAQIFLFRSSGVQFQIGEFSHTSTEPMLLIIPPDIPHGFRFSMDVSGDVISLRLSDIPMETRHIYQSEFGGLGGILSGADSESFASIAALIAQLRTAYGSMSPKRTQIMFSLVHLIALYTTSDQSERRSLGLTGSNPKRGRYDVKAELFCTALEKSFDQALSVSDYAAMIGVSAPQLTRICRTALGSSPNDLVRQRRILEAKRLLEYTRLNISEIAERCGFQDPAYFSRAFRAKTKASPVQYRRELEREFPIVTPGA
ncbi:MAG: helix-turn-helix domain-containing protein [Pseudomonadota bacterium]